MSANWAMVIITAIYAVTTIIILIVNWKSSKAAQEQVIEMRREFEEENRPIIEVEIVWIERIAIALRFVNRGRHVAEHVRIDLDQDFIDHIPEAAFALQLKEQREKECIIGVAQTYDLLIGTAKLIQDQDKKPIKGRVNYTYGECQYEKEFCVDLENYMTYFSVEGHEEKLRKLLVEQNRELGKLGESVNTVSQYLNDLIKN